MAIINEGKNVITCPGIILWDGIKTPDVSKIDGSISHNLTIAIPANSPIKAEIEQIANAALVAGPLKGKLPRDGKWPIKEIELDKFGDSAPLLVGHIAITARTRNGVPPVYDANGLELNAMQYGRMIYPGAVVTLLVHAYSYNGDGNRGVSAGLDGIQIIDATAPKLDVSGGMSASQVAAAFAGTPAPAPAATGMPPAPTPAPAATAMAPAPTPAPHPGFVTDAGTAPPPAPVPEVRYNVNGTGYTEAQLIASGWTPVAIAALPRV